METLATPGGNNQSVSAISSSMKKISYATGRLSSNVMQSPLLKDNSVKQTLDSDTKTSAIVKANTGGDVVMTSIPSIDVTSRYCLLCKIYYIMYALRNSFLCEYFLTSYLLVFYSLY